MQSDQDISALEFELRLAMPVVTAGTFELVIDDEHQKHLDLRLQALQGLGQRSAERLQARGIRDQRDLLLFAPRKYRPVSHFVPGPEMWARRTPHVEFFAPIADIRLPRTPKQPVEVTLDCNGQPFRVLWFNMQRAAFIRLLEPGQWMHVEGDVEYDRNPVPTLAHPRFELLADAPVEIPESYTSVVPVYPGLEGVRDALIRSAIQQSADTILPYALDIVPRDQLQSLQLPTIAKALSIVHVLKSFDDLDRFRMDLEHARNRLVYEEFYTLQLKLAENYAEQRRGAQAPRCRERELAREAVRRLPWPLTGDQKSAMATIADELADSAPMQRLLQGDVGSGKTVVAFMAAAIAAGSGQQVAMMAPTDILARQHLRRAQATLGEVGIQVGFLGASSAAGERRETLTGLLHGQLDLVIGTHALLSEEIAFKQLGLVIVDEQHKFGVEQREALCAKGRDPHLLTMTATPIPRSLAHAVFGDLDLTVIREKPAGRKPVRTEVRDQKKADQVYRYLRQRVHETQEQAYIVFPLVEASDKVDGRKSVLDEAARLKDGVFSGLRVEILHGRMSGEVKDRVMQHFADGDIDILCATTVVEVGVDVANATLMVIESAELFGLSQLHQLRGRVGRGTANSICVLLVGQQVTSDAHARLSSFAQTDDGFALAEADLQIRGPGQFLGVRQAGQAEFRFADLLRDAHLLEEARLAARQVVFGGQK